MIAKLSTGNGFKGCVRYEGKIGMLEGMSRFLDAQGLTVDYDAEGNLLINPNQVAWDFRQQVMGYQGDGSIRKPVYHWVLSYSPEDEVSEEQMLQNAREFLERIGFSDTQYLIAVHYDKAHKHNHIVANVVDNQGKRIPTMGLIDKAHEVAADITKKNGYTWGKAATKKTIEKAHKPHEKVRYELEAVVKEALASSMSISELQNILQSKNVSCQVRRDKANNPVGISFSVERDGQTHTFKGSSLDRQLSIANIQKAIEEKNDRLAYQAAMREEVEIQALRKAYATKYLPLFSKAAASCDKAYTLYLSSKDKCIDMQNALTAKFDELKAIRHRIAAVEGNIQKANSAKTLATAAGAAVALINPLAGLAISLVGRILASAESRMSRSDKRALCDQVDEVYKDISAIRQDIASLEVDRNDKLRVYLGEKRQKVDLAAEMAFTRLQIENTRKSLQMSVSFLEQTANGMAHDPKLVESSSKRYQENLKQAEELISKAVKNEYDRLFRPAKIGHITIDYYSTNQTEPYINAYMDIQMPGDVMQKYKVTLREGQLSAEPIARDFARDKSYLRSALTRLGVTGNYTLIEKSSSIDKVIDPGDRIEAYRLYTEYGPRLLLACTCRAAGQSTTEYYISEAVVPGRENELAFYNEQHQRFTHEAVRNNLHLLHEQRVADAEKRRQDERRALNEKIEKAAQKIISRHNHYEKKIGGF